MAIDVSSGIGSKSALEKRTSDSAVPVEKSPPAQSRPVGSDRTWFDPSTVLANLDVTAALAKFNTRTAMLDNLDKLVDPTAALAKFNTRTAMLDNLDKLVDPTAALAKFNTRTAMLDNLDKLVDPTAALAKFNTRTAMLDNLDKLVDPTAALAKFNTRTAMLDNLDKLVDPTAALAKFNTRTAMLDNLDKLVDPTAALAKFNTRTAMLDNLDKLVDPTAALAKFNTRTAMLDNLDKLVDPTAALAKFNTSTAMLDNLDLSAVLANIAKIDPHAILADLAKNPMLESLALRDELDVFFAELPRAEKLLDEASNALGLTVPFGHDHAVRTALQILVMTGIFSTLFVAFLVNPVLGAALSALGTPNAVVTWKATGKAYDRLYSRENNHPDKALEKVQPSSTNQRHRHGRGNRDSW
ncbi:hypothetical protein ACSBOX_21385 (plasmid) [Arthrobacter sp. KN11-1C]|uniref:hypothetical protein n=1 Tax=Arthrobacter sp. KN11-1C TaxID=3445774 RepID=UPI003FA0CE2C